MSLCFLPSTSTASTAMEACRKLRKFQEWMGPLPVLSASSWNFFFLTFIFLVLDFGLLSNFEVLELALEPKGWP